MNRNTTIIKLYIEKSATFNELMHFQMAINKRKLEINPTTSDIYKVLNQYLGVDESPIDITENLYGRNKLQAIKRIKGLYGYDLRSAKEIVDQVCEQCNI